MARFAARRADVFQEAALLSTIERLSREGHVTADEADRLSAQLPSQLQKSRYVLGHLAAHVSLGTLFAFDLLPLPLGMISRASWVIGNRVYETVCRRTDRAHVHSAAVLVMSVIPFVGNLAYLIPLRAQGREIVYLMANHISYRCTDRSISDALRSRPAWMVRMVERLTGGLSPPANKADDAEAERTALVPGAFPLREEPGTSAVRSIEDDSPSRSGASERNGS